MVLLMLGVVDLVPAQPDGVNVEHHVVLIVHLVALGAPPGSSGPAQLQELQLDKLVLESRRQEEPHHMEIGGVYLRHM